MPVTVIVALILIQAQQGDGGDALRLARIRRALADTTAIRVESATRLEGPVFRVTIRQRTADPPPWANWTAVPSNIRPWFHADHSEFLEQVTPEQFRTATLYPVGVPVLTVAEFVARRIKSVQRKAAEAAARGEVQQALEAFRACRANPARPGC